METNILEIGRVYEVYGRFMIYMREDKKFPHYHIYIFKGILGKYKECCISSYTVCWNVKDTVDEMGQILYGR